MHLNHERRNLTELACSIIEDRHSAHHESNCNPRTRLHILNGSGRPTIWSEASLYRTAITRKD